MSNELRVFENPEFGKVRTVEETNGEIWFVANDVCAILEIANTSDAINNLESDEKATVGNTDCFNKIKELRHDTRLINESGLYALVFKSRKPNARKFRKWVTSELIPTIRKTGGYGKQFAMPKNFPEALERYAAELRRNEQLEAENENYRFRLGESEEFHKVSEDPWIRATFSSRAFGYIGGVVKDMSEKMGLPIHETPHPVHGHVNVYSKDAISAFRIMCEHDPDYLAKWRID